MTAATRYAAGTIVPMERSRAEAEKTLQRYGATGFGYAWEERRELVPATCDRCKAPPGPSCTAHTWAVRKETTKARQVVAISFQMSGRRVLLEVPMPTEAEAGTKARHEAAIRQRWRALVLVLKAKLEAVASGISTLELEFLANVVMPDGRTIGQAIVPRLTEITSGRLMLPAAQEPQP